MSPGTTSGGAPRARGGRLTLPIEAGMDDAVRALIERLGADAVRNSDGTELPGIVDELDARVYATYFVGRGDNEWADAHPDAATRVFLMSERVTATSTGPLPIDLLAGWFDQQVRPDAACDITRWWQAIDRTTGQTLSPDEWSLGGDGRTVTIARALIGHVYTIDFLATQIWDPTQMYNYITNGWHNEPDRAREKPFDVRHEATWDHARENLDHWLDDHPEVDVVRFTTFFYHFTLIYGPDATERYVDWLGYTASVSVPALEAFEAEHGYSLTPEDFVDEGYYNSTFRTPSPAFRDWVAFQHRFVTSRVRELTDAVHARGKEAMMFLGDNWIGTEPYGPHFAQAGVDAVVGSIGSGVTCRMVSDIPGASCTEGRLLPYFFPDVFYPGGDPAREARTRWLESRRAIVRSPLDRIGYGGYLSLAMHHPDFLDQAERIATEFRSLHERSGGRRPLSAPYRVGVLTPWGGMRPWMSHMVAHGLRYRQAYSHLGVLESLAGLPLDVAFLSFDDVRHGVPDDVAVLINAGAAGTSFSGGAEWDDPALESAITAFVASGGGFIGVGAPSERPGGGTTLRLAHILGVDREIGWSLGMRRPMEEEPDHFITRDLTEPFDDGEGQPDIVVVSPGTRVLRADDGQVRLAVHSLGRGRSVYATGLPYNSQNSRLLHRAIAWAARAEDTFDQWATDDPRTEVAHYPDGVTSLVINNSDDAVVTTVHLPALPGGTHQPLRRQVILEPGGHQWLVPQDH